MFFARLHSVPSVRLKHFLQGGQFEDRTVDEWVLTATGVVLGFLGIADVNFIWIIHKNLWVDAHFVGSIRRHLALFSSLNDLCRPVKIFFSGQSCHEAVEAFLEDVTCSQKLNIFHSFRQQLIDIGEIQLFISNQNVPYFRWAYWPKRRLQVIF